MANKRKTLFFSILIVFSLVLAAFPIVLGQSGTNVSGIITSDTTWTKTGSPYSLTGPVAINQGVTLTIEPGVTVNLNHYYLQVNGTLVAKGTNTDQIKFNGGSSQGITFTSLSNQWNEAAGSGCIIQYATIKPVIASDGSVKIDHCTDLGGFTVAGSSVITNNNLKSGASVYDSTLLSNNVISGMTGAGPVAPTPIVFAMVDTTSSGVLTISNNIINGGSPISGGQIGISCYRYIRVINNTINACEEGIRVISSGTSGYPIIEKNFIYDNQAGIVIRASASNSPLIKANLITNNQIGISVESNGGIATPTIQNNNIYSNNFNLGWSVSNNIDVMNNWWGATDAQTINQTIGDSKNDFNFGTVNFIPFLTAPNPNAPTPPPIPSPSASPTPSPSVPEFPVTTTLAIMLIVVMTATIFYKNKHKTQQT